MIELGEESRVYIFTGPTDMRKGFDTLAALVQLEVGKSPLAGGIFVFFSRRRDRAKILTWDRDGFLLIYKRLEAGVFRVEEKDGFEVVTGVDLKLLLQGMELSRIKLRKAAKSGVFSTEASC